MEDPDSNDMFVGANDSCFQSTWDGDTFLLKPRRSGSLNPPGSFQGIKRHALELYYDLLTLKEPPMRILFLLAKQYRQLLLAKQFAAAGLAQTEIGSKLGVPGFVVKNITTCARAYTISELEQAVKDFVDAEESVKTGRLEDKLSVELLIIKYSSKVK